MHKIHSKPFELSDFSCDKLTDDSLKVFTEYISYMESVRIKYIESKNKRDWYDLIQLLPSSYNQMRTLTLNYETLTNIYFARKDHKLDEWHVFCDFIKTLPYADLMIIKDTDK